MLRMLDLARFDMTFATVCVVPLSANKSVLRADREGLPVNSRFYTPKIQREGKPPQERVILCAFRGSRELSLRAATCASW